MGRAKDSWMAFVRRLGQIQTTVVLTLIYVLVYGPSSVLLRVFGRGDLLELRREEGTSFARSKVQTPTDRERCERQF